MFLLDSKLGTLGYIAVFDQTFVANQMIQQT